MEFNSEYNEKEWIMCRDCIYVDECSNATNRDGCYFGATKEEDWEEE